MPQCSRCGREITMGTYCDTCQFYIYNDTCWRCRMYLPKVELQQWRGQTYCPYCMQDIRDDERKDAERKGEGSREPGKGDESGAPPGGTPFGAGQKNPDYECDKCKNDLEIVYVIADHKFCEVCFQQQLRTWKEDKVKVPPYMKFNAKADMGLFARLMRFLKNKIREEWAKRTKRKKKVD